MQLRRFAVAILLLWLLLLLLMSWCLSASVMLLTSSRAPPCTAVPPPILLTPPPSHHMRRLSRADHRRARAAASAGDPAYGVRHRCQAGATAALLGRTAGPGGKSSHTQPSHELPPPHPLMRIHRAVAACTGQGHVTPAHLRGLWGCVVYVYGAVFSCTSVDDDRLRPARVARVAASRTCYR